MNTLLVTEFNSFSNAKRVQQPALLHFLFTLVVALAVSSVVYGQGRTNFPPEGKLVDAGGHRLHVHAMGKGSPTVVMENGSGDFSFIWSLVQPEVAKFTRAVTYDRAGYAWSEAGPLPRTFRQITLELHTALHNAGLNGPYVLVGQSYGGFLVRAFAQYYPDEVVGMVLVDAVNEDSRIIMNGKPFRIRDWAKGLAYPAPQVYPLQVNTGKELKKSNYPLDTALEPPLDKLPKDIQQVQLWAQSDSTFRSTVNEEMTWSPEELATLYANRGKPVYMLGAIPLIVLSRGDGGYGDLPDAKGLEEERVRLQHDLATLSTNSKQIADPNSGHNIHLEDPVIVVNAIREVLAAVKSKKPLTGNK